MIGIENRAAVSHSTHTARQTCSKCGEIGNITSTSSPAYFKDMAQLPENTPPKRKLESDVDSIRAEGVIITFKTDGF